MKKDIYDEGECWFDDLERYGIPNETSMPIVFGSCSVLAFIIVMLKYVGGI